MLSLRAVGYQIKSKVLVNTGKCTGYKVILLTSLSEVTQLENLKRIHISSFILLQVARLIYSAFRYLTN